MTYENNGSASYYSIIKGLRKEGKLDEAEAVVEEYLQRENNPWAWRACFWVMYSQCKKASMAKEHEKVKAYCEKAANAKAHLEDDKVVCDCFATLHSLIMPHYDEVRNAEQLSKSEASVQEAYQQIKAIYDRGDLDESLHESFGWILYRYLKARYQQLGSVEARRTLVVYMKLKNPRPSLLHSQILNLASHMAETFHDFRLTDFLRLWDTANLREEDYQSQERPDDNAGLKTIRPLIVRIVERCFDTGASFNDVKNLLAGSELTEEDLKQTFSSSYYNRLFKLGDGSVHGNAERSLIGEYMDRVNGMNIRNEYHSKILRSVLRNWTERDELIYNWLPEWGFANFMEQDWEEVKQDAKTFQSLVQRAISAYNDACKKLRTGCTDDFANLLKEAIMRYPDKDYYRRDYAKYLIDKGKKDEAIEEYKRMLCIKNDFYLWKELSEMVDNEGLRRSAICMGILSAGKEQQQYIGALRLRLASTLIEENNYAAAKHELYSYHLQKEEDGSRISSEYDALMRRIPQDTTATKGNHKLYEEGSMAIEEFVYSDLPTRMMVVERLYDNKDGKPRARLISSGGEKVSVNQHKLQRLGKKKYHSYYEVTLFRIEDKLKMVVMKPVERDECLKAFPKHVAVVDNVNETKQLFHLAFDNGEDCVVRFSETPLRPQTGDMVEVTDVKEANEKRHHVLLVEATDKTMYQVRDVVGPVSLKVNAKGRRIGFVEGVYIPESMLNGVNDGDVLSIRALLWKCKYRALTCRKWN